MPKKKVNTLKSSAGTNKRLTEKNFYRFKAEAEQLRDLQQNLNRIPRKNARGRDLLSEKAGDCLDYLYINLELLNEYWKEYTNAYTEVDSDLQEMSKESKSAADFYGLLTACLKRMEDLKKDRVFRHPEFAAVRAELMDLYGHYHEMQFGTLDTSLAAMNKTLDIRHVSPDPEILSEKMIEKVMKDVDSRGDQFLQKEGQTETLDFHYVDRSDEPLFPHEPCPDDIAQGSLGDCYLLATLSAICTTNPHLIRSLMKDNGKTVTVPVWQMDQYGQPSSAPQYVTVTKSVPAIEYKRKSADGTTYTDTRYVFGRTALWVQMIEKAYAAAGMHRNRRTKAEENPNYSDIAGGAAIDALTAVLGKFTETTYVFASQTTNSSMDIRDPETLHDFVRGSIDDKDILVCATSEEMNSPALKEKYHRLVEEKIAVYKAEHPDETEEKRKKAEENLRKEAADIVYFGLSVRIDDQGEPVLRNHEYAVTNTYEQDGKKYIVVRNPHGRYGQNPGDIKSFDKEQRGYSAIPIEEFRHLFRDMVSSQPAASLPRRDYAKDFRSITALCFSAIEDSRSQMDIACDVYGSKEFREFYTALQEADKLCQSNERSNRTLFRAFQKLSKKAEDYVVKEGMNAEADDARNIRVSVAKACMTLVEGYKMKHNPEKVKELQRSAAQMMVADRASYYLHKHGQPLTENISDRSHPGFAKLLDSMTTAELLAVALKASPEKIPKAFREIEKRHPEAVQKTAQSGSEAVQAPAIS